MATRLFGMNIGQSLENVTEAIGPATTTNNIEINVDLSAVIVTDPVAGTTRTVSRTEVLLVLNILTQYIERKNWPPA